MEAPDHYRFEKEYCVTDDCLKIVLVTYVVVKTTNEGYWIKNPKGELYWVFKVSDQRHAYQTKKEAFVSFVIRNKKAKAKAIRDLEEAETCIKLIHLFNIKTL